MAYSTLVLLENSIDQILIHSQYPISPHEKQQIISIDKYVVSFRAFIEDFPEKAKHLEARIMDVATEAEDMIEWFMVEQFRRSIFRCTRRIKFKFQLHKVIKEMDSIAGEVVELKNSTIRTNEMVSSSQNAAGKMKMVGFDQDLLEMKDRLCGGSRQLQILPITGMGGIGKTILARNAYDDPLVVENFDIRVWITISQDYSEERILSDRILSDLVNSTKELFPERRKESEEGESKGEKAVKVYQALYGKRFLIVMDDLWSTKVLDDAKKLFPNINDGSRILLTTRLGDVADSTTSSHEICLMDADQSWDLLREKVLEQHDCITNEVESIGKEIASSCRGLPLAVVVVAGKKI